MRGTARILLLVLLPAFAPRLDAAPAPTPGPGDGGPAAFVTAVYRVVVSGDGDQGGQFFWLEPKVRPGRLSSGLLDLWARADELRDKDGDDLGPIDWDPVTASQDPVVKSFTVQVERQDARSATVAVTLVDPRGKRPAPSDAIVRWDLVKEGGAWKVDDLRGSAGGRPWSVRESLKRYLDR